MSNQTNNNAEVKNRSQLAQKYQVSYHTMRKWLFELGFAENIRVFTPIQIQFIFDSLGEPFRLYKIKSDVHNTVKALSDVYGITIPTFRIWIKQLQNSKLIGIGRKFTPRQVMFIIDYLNLP